MQPLYPEATPLSTWREEFIVIDRGGSFGRNTLSNLNLHISKSFSTIMDFQFFSISYIKVNSDVGGLILK